MCIRDRVYKAVSSLINDNDAGTTAYEIRRWPRKQKTVTSNALIPVSYTHLDVYKRQLFTML